MILPSRALTNQHMILLDIGLSKPKLNIFVDDIFLYHILEKGSLSIETK